MVDHEVDEFAGFRADLVVHLLGGPDHKGVVARRLGVAVREDHLLVVPHDMVDAETLCLRVIELLAQRHEECAHLLPEGRDFLFAVVRASLLQIAHGNVVFIAQIFAHLVADVDEFAPDLLQTRLVVLVELGVRLDGGGTHRAVGMLEVFLDAVKIQGLAVKGNLGGGHDLLVLVGQAAFLLTQRDVGFTEQLLLQVHGDKVLLAEFPLDVRTEGAGRDGFAERHLVAAEGGQRVLQIIDLRLIEFVPGVQSVADVCDGILGEQFAALAVDLKNQAAQGAVALRLPDCGFPLGEFCPARLQIGALVFQC